MLAIVAPLRLGVPASPPVGCGRAQTVPCPGCTSRPPPFFQPMSMTPSSVSPSSSAGAAFSPRNWRIGLRLSVGFGVLIALMLAMVVVGVVRVSSLLEANRLIIEREWSKAEAANTLSSIA